MLDFSSFLDLPLIWGILIGTAIIMYVILDGFDLGVGILFPLAPSDKCRDRMMNSIAPFWDGNETWLVLGGGGLFAAFPLAYSLLMSAFYMPIFLMLFGLILRGVAFEFRFKATESQRVLWDYAFHFGSLMAAFFQGVILGAFVDGVEVTNNAFVGSPFNWATGLSITAGIAVVFGYALLGATWLVMKTEDVTQSWGRKVGVYALFFVAVFMGIVSIAMIIMNPVVKSVWFHPNNFYILSVIPIFTAFLFIVCYRDLHIRKHEYTPFIYSICIFLGGYIGLGVGLYPWLVPFKYTIWDCAAAPESLSLMLVGVLPLLPLILGYTFYSYYVFRGKSSHEKMY